MKKTCLFLAVGLVFVMSCKKTDTVTAANCGSKVATFASDVNPILQSTCTINSGCHGSGSRNGPGSLLSYSQVYNARLSIRSAVANGSMPQNGTLSSAEKTAILCWIDNGALNN